MFEKGPGREYPDWYVEPKDRKNPLLQRLSQPLAFPIPQQGQSYAFNTQRSENFSVADLQQNWVPFARALVGLTDHLGLSEKTYSLVGEVPILGSGNHFKNHPGLEDIEKTVAQSPFNREMVSLMWDDALPAETDKPAWYVPPQMRQNEVVRAISNAPVRALVDLAANNPGLIYNKALLKPANLSTQPGYEVQGDYRNKSRFFTDIREAVQAFAATDTDGEKMLIRHSNDRSFTVIGNEWLDEGQTHKFAYMTGEVEQLHRQIVAQTAQPDRALKEIPASKVEASVTAEAERHIACEKEIAGIWTRLHSGKSGEQQQLAAQPDKATLSARIDEKGAQMSQAENTEHKRIYLNVPFSEKNQAKALGAKWDRHAKAWYARDDMDIKPFAQWTEAKTPNPAPKIRPEDEFAQALREHGLILEGPPTMDGKWHRVAVEGDRKGQQSGSYRGFLEGIPAGNITNHKSGQDPVKWVATGTKIDPKELERAKAEAAVRKATQEQELRAQYRAVAKRAYGIFQNAEPAPAHHAYLQNKQVPAGDLRIDQSGNLLMPVANDKGFVENIQTIHPDGTKMFLKDGKKRGLMHVIKGEAKGPMIISEGYSTGQSLHMATGLTVVVALDSGNLAPVAEALHKKHPDRPLVIAADDDHAKKVNAGIKGAERASELTGAKILRPDLSDAEKAKGLTDFNDIHRERGLEALKRLVTEQLGLTKPKAKTRIRGREQQAASLAV